MPVLELAPGNQDQRKLFVGLLVGGPRLPWNPRKTWSGLCGFVLWGTVATAVLIRWTQRAVLDAAAQGVPEPPTWIGGAFLGVTGNTAIPESHPTAP